MLNSTKNSALNNRPKLATKLAPKLAIVVPCYNEEAVITHTYNALCQKLDSLIAKGAVAKDSFLCFVDDGSADRTCEILLSLKNAKNSPSLAEGDKGGGYQHAINSNDTQFANANSTLPLAPSAREGKIKSGNSAREGTKGKFAVIASEQSERGNLGNLNTNSNSMDCHEPNGSRNDKLAGVTSHNDNANSPHKLIKLTRNYGQQNALLAGLEFVKDKCDCVVSMDCDLQDDINALDEMLFKFKNGADVVYGVRKARDNDTAFKKYSALSFYKFMQIMGIQIPDNHAHYRLLSARACQNLLEFKEVNLFLRGIVPLVGYKSEVVYYERLARFAGDTKYSFMSLFSLAWDAITSFSIAPLRMMSIIGVLLFLLSIIYGIYALYMKFFTAVPISGWTSTILVLLFFGGMQFLGLGIMGEYIGKIYAEVKHRPRYFVEAVL